MDTGTAIIDVPCIAILRLVTQKRDLASFSNRQLRKEGTLLCVGVGGDQTTSPAPEDQDMPAFAN